MTVMSKALFPARLVATLVPAALLGGAVAFEKFGGLFPCEMCWWQRYAHIAALGLAVAAWLRPGSRALVALAGAAIAVAGLIGGYHAGIEYGWWQGITACTTTVKFSGGDPLQAIMAAPVIRCDVAQWKLLGISLAGYDFIFSLLGAALVWKLLPRRAKGGFQ